MLKKLVITVLSVLLIGIVPVKADNTVTVNVNDYGAIPNDNVSDTSAIQSALDQAMNLQSGQTLIVNIPEGTYNLDGHLGIMSNTILNLTGNTNIVANTYFTYLLKGKHYHTCGTKQKVCYGATYNDENGVSHNCDIGGYNQESNITISGGHWIQTSDAYTSYTTSIFKINHCNHITIKDMTVSNASNHYFNLAASNNVTISNVTFNNAVSYLGNSADFWSSYTVGDATRYKSIEAIHLDAANSVGESSSFPLDNTHCSNITVTNCTFSNVHGGIGNHHVYAFKGDTFTFTNNRFDSLDGYAINCYSMNNVNISNNTCNNAYMFVRSRACTNIGITSNTVSNNSYMGIQVRGDTSSDPFVGTVSNNSISNSSKYDLEVWDYTYNSTIINNALTKAIHVSSNIANNNISNNGQDLTPVAIGLPYNSTTYNGSNKTPGITGIDSSYISVSYANNKNVGTATVTVTGKGLYYGSKTFTFRINPKGTKLTKVSKGSKSFTVKWSKQRTQTTGYQIQYSKSKNMTSSKIVTITSNKTTSKKIKKLSKKKTYYIRIRTYKTVSGVRYYSGWSGKKSVKTR